MMARRPLSCMGTSAAKCTTGSRSHLGCLLAVWSGVDRAAQEVCAPQPTCAPTAAQRASRSFT